MESQKIKILLEQYWAEKTTVKEEKQLLAWFNGEVPSSKQQYDKLFQYKTIVQNTKEDFNLAFLDEPIHQASKKGIIQFKGWRIWTATAAAVVLIMVLSITYQWNNLRPLTASTESEIQEEKLNTAYEETLMALAYLSEKLNKGNNSIYQLSAFDQTKKQAIHEN